ncbi:hypothetical protein L484_003851 [Morus notabilis]|uniref:Uncharacterized protein n=1 Tax=Morus notabilis TaxID=981085 RepID=W9RPB1_9ROSA|nr:hypothetical protein L484_003851 [Morus notabilis]
MIGDWSNFDTDDEREVSYYQRSGSLWWSAHQQPSSPPPPSLYYLHCQSNHQHHDRSPPPLHHRHHYPNHPHRHHTNLLSTSSKRTRSAPILSTNLLSTSASSSLMEKESLTKKKSLTIGASRLRFRRWYRLYFYYRASLASINSDAGPAMTEAEEVEKKPDAAAFVVVRNCPPHHLQACMLELRRDRRISPPASVVVAVISVTVGANLAVAAPVEKTSSMAAARVLTHELQMFKHAQIGSRLT